MTNAELITVLREAKKHFWTQPQIELYPMMESAADALEAAEKRVAELEAQLPKEGEWIPSMYTYPDGTTEHNKDEWYGELYECSICHYVMIGEVNYCPNCGAQMKTVTDCHTLEER